MVKKYIGDKEFYLRVLRVALPIALSQLLIHCNAVIDSIMVSSIGQVTAIGNAYNVVNLYHYISYGIEAGICLFSAQFFGAKQYKNMAKSQGLGIFLGMFNALFWIAAVYIVGDKLLLFYLNDEVVMVESLKYIRIECLAFIPMTISKTFKCQYQAMHKTKIAFIESAIFVLLSILCKYVCMFVLDLGIVGVGIGSLITEIIMCVGFIVYAIKDKPVFLFGFKELFSFDVDYIKTVLLKILPCAFNEVLFGFGQTLFNKAYGMLGSASMESIYISSDILSMVLFAVWGYGDAVSILVGTQLGRGRIEEAKEESKYHLGLSFVIGAILCLFMIFSSPIILSLYSIEDISIYNECVDLLSVYGLKAFLRTFTYVMFCTLKAGGDSKAFNLLDSGIMYTVGIPIAFACVYLGMKDIVFVVLVCQIEQVIRFVLTLKRYNSYKWANNLTASVN